MQMDLNQPTKPTPSYAPANFWKQITLYLLILGVLGICFFIVYPFLSGIIGAIVLAVITKRPHDWLTHKIKNRNLCAALSVVLVILSVIIPGFFILQDLVQGTTTIIIFLRSDIPQQTITNFLNTYPTIASDIHVVSNSIDIQGTVRSIAAILGNLLAGFLSYSFGAITQLVIMLFLLFFLYRDQEMFISFARSILPFNEEETDHLLDNMTSTINATALGRLVIAAIQAVLAGIAFWILGVPNTMLWTVMTGVVAILPAVGTSLVWIPIAVFLGLTGNLGKAALLTIWGTFVVSSIDNFLYPMLVGSKLNQHTVGILLAILGGVVIFGLPGVILGPLAFTIAATLLDIWRARNNNLQPIPPPPQG
jgi:predicted PurR-regulated permease PerM